MTEKSQQIADQIKDNKKSHQVGGFLEIPKIFGQVTWKHNVLIVSIWELSNGGENRVKKEYNLGMFFLI